MTVRERLEQEEYRELSPLAQKSAETKGRLYSEEDSDARTCYQRDADRIVHSKSFRRLMHKTQVFLSPEGDHYRTRMTHTIEVSRIARTICRGLRLNEDLAEAAAYGHDLGHTPFGHAGEAALTDVTGKPFRHNEQSLRVVDKLEHDGAGLNLTYEVRMAEDGHARRDLEGIGYPARDRGYPRSFPFGAHQYAGHGYDRPYGRDRHARNAAGGRRGDGRAAEIHVRPGLYQSRGHG